MTSVDDQLLARVRALLAKAESTEFPDEAEAFTAKAQQLMARHRIDRALVDDAEPSRPGTRDLVIDAPYASVKSYLLQVVAEPNGCRSVYDSRSKTSTLFGPDADLDLVETLYTSLLVQADAAVRRAGSVRDVTGRSRTRSFRRSFLIAFAARIGDRLAEQVQVVEAEAAPAERDAALPVLARQRADVDALVAELVPEVQRSAVRSSNGAGWSAGRAAADLADLTVGPAVR